MPTIGAFHSFYWAGSNGGGAAPGPSGSGKSGYQLWQRSVIGFCLLLYLVLGGV